MLRIETMRVDDATVTLKLEGRIAAEWVSLLDQECLSWLQEGRKVLLDVSAVSFIDGRGLEMMLRGIASGSIEVINTPALLEELLKGGGGP